MLRTLTFYPHDSKSLWEMTDVIQLSAGTEYLVSVNVFPSDRYDWTEYQDRVQ